jgi:hypothetical protein
LSDAIKHDSGDAGDKLYLMLALRELLEGVGGFMATAVKGPIDQKLFEIASDAYEKFFDLHPEDCSSEGSDVTAVID